MTGFYYQRYYCEENAWWMARAPQLQDQRRWLLFISNRNRTCAMWGQRNAERGLPLVWDYHVVVVTRPTLEGPARVWDLDAVGELPRPAEAWLQQSFPYDVPPPFEPRFRLVDHATVLAQFASDRRHMRDEEGVYRACPPTWPCIVSQLGAVHTLDAFVEMEGDGPGEVFSLDSLRDWFSSSLAAG